MDARAFRHYRIGMANRLEPVRILSLAQALELRISERFPGASLCEVAKNVVTATQDAGERATEISSPHWPLRIVRFAFITCFLALLLWIFAALNPFSELVKWSGIKELISIIEPALGTGVFLGAFVLFVWGLEDRWKRGKALEALHELRSLAHIVDIHQLTKDPQHVLVKVPNTANSPKRTLNAIELGRYFDYSSELLAVISKVAAIYAQELNDPVALSSVDQIEALTSGLSRKIWQKMSLLPQFEKMAAVDLALPVYNRPLPKTEPAVPAFKTEATKPGPK